MKAQAAPVLFTMLWLLIFLQKSAKIVIKLNKWVRIMNYGELTKKLRSKLILTQSEFGKLLGVSFTTVCRWETGKYEPTIKQKRRLVELCKEQNIEIEEVR
ncbi:MAG: helix-turn-helix domain-containing protein [Clostridia bacterium]|nr:helix-turn-helix domain-containing protein [Clostridia bacterium]